MLKKILLAIFAMGIIFQAAAIGLWNYWVSPKSQMTDMKYITSVPTFLTGLAVGAKSQVYIEANGLELYQEGQLTKSFDTQEIGLKAAFIDTDASGRVWVTSYHFDDGISVFDGQKWIHLDGAVNSPIRDMGVDTKSRVWVATESGLYMYDGGQLQEFNTSNSSIPGNIVSTLSFDKDGQVWIAVRNGTDGVEGTELAFTDGVKWNNFEGKSKIAKGFWDIQTDKNGGLWAGGMDGLYFFNGSKWITYTPDNSTLKYPQSLNLALDSQNRLWVVSGVGNQIITVFDGRSWKYVYDYGYNMEIRAGLDGNMYVRSGNILKAASPDIHLMYGFENTLKKIVDYGFFIYLTIFLIGAWLMIAFNAWGIGVALLGGGLAFLLFFESPLYALYFNPGLYATVGGILGGLAGRFFKRTDGKFKYAGLWGGGIGCGALLLLTGCPITVLIILTGFQQ